MSWMDRWMWSVAAEEVAGVDFVGDILKVFVETVGDDGRRLFLESLEIVYNSASEEC